MNIKNYVKPVLRGAVFSLLIGMAPLTIMVLVPMLNSQYIAPSALASFAILSAGFGLLTYLGAAFTRHLQRKLGRLTGFAAIVGGTAVAGTALAAVLQTCPGSFTGEACSVPEAASWGLSLSLLVTLLVCAWVFSAGIYQLFKKLITSYLAKRQQQAEEAAEEEFQQEVEEGRSRARSRDPQEPKGYPTPKREQRKKKRKNRSTNTSRKA